MPADGGDTTQKQPNQASFDRVIIIKKFYLAFANIIIASRRNDRLYILFLFVFILRGLNSI